MALPNENELREKLHKLHDWPTVFMFKFIVKNESEKIDALAKIFSDPGKISIKESKNGKFASFTATEVVTKVDEVIEKYRKVSEIEGVISL
jgi:putative lipoic acid-binding regulatory protein